MHPGFLRFPGGCIVEGRYLEYRYQWKTTIGDPNDRTLIINRWNDEFPHKPAPDYYQSYGLGFFEYFQLAEDIGAEPLPILNCGMVRKRRVPTVRGDRGRLSLIHLDDAVSATMRALDSVPGVYDIVDDHPVSLSEMVQTLAAYSGAHPPLTVPAWLLRLLSPYIARMLAPRPAISNAAAKAVLGWRPAYPSLGDGLARMFPQAA